MSKRVFGYYVLCIAPGLIALVAQINTDGPVLGLDRKVFSICAWLLYAGGFAAYSHVQLWVAGGFLRSYLMGEAICWDCLRVVPARDDGLYLCPTCPNQTGPNRLRHRRDLPEYLKRVMRPTVLLKRDRTASHYVLGGAVALGILGFAQPIPSTKWLVMLAAAVAVCWMFYLAISDLVFKRRAKKQIAAGRWSCWNCQYRVDMLPPEVERCPECGTVLKISEYEWRQWLGLGAGKDGSTI